MRHSPGPAPTLNIRPDFSCPKSWDPQEKTPSQISQEILPKPVQQIAPENCVDSQARILFFERRTYVNSSPDRGESKEFSKLYRP